MKVRFVNVKGVEWEEKIIEIPKELEFLFDENVDEYDFEIVE